jgi:hypothetical protein
VVKSISANSREPPAPTIIVPAKRYIEDWYTDVITGQEQVLLTNTRYINKEKAIEWLDRFIVQVGASLN